MPEEALKALILDRFESVKACAEAAGLPYTTLNSILQRGVARSGAGNLLRLCRLLQLDPAALAAGQLAPQQPASPLTPAEQAQLAAYHGLDSHGKELVCTVLQKEAQRCAAAGADRPGEAPPAAAGTPAARQLPAAPAGTRAGIPAAPPARPGAASVQPHTRPDQPDAALVQPHMRAGQLGAAPVQPHTRPDQSDAAPVQPGALSAPPPAAVPQKGRKLLLVARRTPGVPEEEYEKLRQYFEKTIDLYLQARGISFTEAPAGEGAGGQPGTPPRGGAGEGEGDTGAQRPKGWERPGRRRGTGRGEV